MLRLVGAAISADMAIKGGLAFRPLGLILVVSLMGADVQG